MQFSILKRLLTRVGLAVPVCLALCAGIRIQAQRVTVVPLPARSLVYNPVTKKLYAGVGQNGPNGSMNSVTVIDPVSGKVENSVPVGGEPGAMVLSDKNQYLYVMVSDGTKIRCISLAAMTAGPSFPVGDGIAASRLAAVPGAPEAIAIMRRRPGISPDNEGMMVYVNGIPTGNRVDPGHQLAQGIAPARLFGYENQISSWGFTTLNLTRDGVEGGGSTGGLISGNVSLAASANGLIITNNGSVIDPEARQVIGQIPGLSEPMLALAHTGVVYSISGRDGRLILHAGNLQTLASLGDLPIQVPGVRGGPGNLVWCGDNLLAFTCGDSIVLTSANLGPSLPRVDLSVKRSPLPSNIARGVEFSYTLTVTNNSREPASHVFLTDQMQSGVEAVSSKASQGDCICANSILRADLGRLPAGGRATVSVTVRVTATENMGFAAVVRGAEPDPLTDNNIDILGKNTGFKLADLAIEWTSAQQDIQGAGAALRATILGVVRIKNIGTKAANACLVRFYAGSGPNFVPSLYILLQQTPVPALAPGETADVQLRAPLEAGDDATGVFMFAQVDPKNEVEEKSKENNVARTQIK